MQETQGSHCKCHFLCPLKERIIRGYPDKAHNYGYGSVRIQIATVMGIIRILPIRVSPYLTVPESPGIYISWYIVCSGHGYYPPANTLCFTPSLCSSRVPKLPSKTPTSHFDLLSSQLDGAFFSSSFSFSFTLDSLLWHRGDNCYRNSSWSRCHTGELRIANARAISCSEFTGGNLSIRGLLFIRLQKSLEYKRQYEYNYIGNNMESVNSRKSLLHKAVDRKGKWSL